MEGTTILEPEDTWEKDYLKDSAKFKIIIEVYRDTFESNESFIERAKVARSSLYHWLKHDDITFTIKNKTKLCRLFGLGDKVWSDKFFLEEEFREALPDYQKITPQSIEDTIRPHLLINLKHIDTKDNSMKVEQLSAQEVEKLLSRGMEQASSSFMFALAKRLKAENRINEALMVLLWIDEQESIFRYQYENQLRHFKAVLLSHDSIQDWDGAIHILRSLYYSRHYHLESPEILTLLASNYKRKALYRSPIDKELLTSALCLYEEAYQLKPDNEKYYDAINLAYLYNITDAIEVEHANKEEIEALYRKLSAVWRIDRSNWWEVSSQAEFLMLLGKTEMAILMMDDFMESHQADPKTYRLEPFGIDALFRQLRLYIQLTDDHHAKQFLEHLEESWAIVGKGR